MRAKACRRGGKCALRMVGNGPTRRGIEVRVCVKGGEVHFTDRAALGLPRQPVVGGGPALHPDILDELFFERNDMS